MEVERRPGSEPARWRLNEIQFETVATDNDDDDDANTFKKWATFGMIPIENLGPKYGYVYEVRQSTNDARIYFENAINIIAHRLKGESLRADYYWKWSW